MPPRPLILLATLLALTACQKTEDKRPAGPPPVLITTTRAQTGTIEVVETTLGTLEARVDPKIAAEVAGRVVRVLATPGRTVRKGELLALIDDTDLALQNRAEEAEAGRIAALLAQQERLVERQQQLVQQGFLSRHALDEARAQRDALREQLAAVQARGELSRRSRGKTRVVAPFDGLIEAQLVSAGDYVKTGDALFLLVARQGLRARLPFPEAAAARLEKGQPVVLTSALLPGRQIRSSVSAIRPAVTGSGRAVEVFADLDAGEGLRPGATVEAAVVVARREHAVLVPEQSVVLRPAGHVVYVVADGRARQRVVEIGARHAGRVEIVSGLAAGTVIALDGAGFLTDNAAVSVREAGPMAESQSPPHGAAPAQPPADTRK